MASTHPWIRIVAPKAVTICKSLALPESVRALLRADPDTAVFYGELAKSELYELATMFLARALARREAVWWACLCVEAGHSGKVPAGEETALLAAVRWVLEPVEANRRAAEEPGRALGINSLGGNLALAAFWSGGSLNPPDLPIRAPSPSKTPEAVARAVLSTVNVVFPHCQPLAFRQFLSLGEGIAAGRYRWKPSGAGA
jgi:hypothetical protein